MANQINSRITGWLVIDNGVIVSAHKSGETARKAASKINGGVLSTPAGNNIVLTIGQRVKNFAGQAIPA